MDDVESLDSQSQGYSLANAESVTPLQSVYDAGESVCGDPLLAGSEGNSRVPSLSRLVDEEVDLDRAESPDEDEGVTAAAQKQLQVDQFIDRFPGARPESETVIADRQEPSQDQAVKSKSAPALGPASDEERTVTEELQPPVELPAEQPTQALLAPVSPSYEQPLLSEEVLPDQPEPSDQPVLSSQLVPSEQALPSETSEEIVTPDKGNATLAATPVSIVPETSSAVPRLPSKVEKEMHRFITRHKEADDLQTSSLELGMWPCEARAVTADGRSSNHLKRPAVSYFLTTQEERLAIACLRAELSSAPAPLIMRSPRRRPYQLKAHCSVQEARIAKEVYGQVQEGGSSGSGTSAMSADEASPSQPGRPPPSPRIHILRPFSSRKVHAKQWARLQRLHTKETAMEEQEIFMSETTEELQVSPEDNDRGHAEGNTLHPPRMLTRERRSYTKAREILNFPPDGGGVANPHMNIANTGKSTRGTLLSSDFVGTLRQNHRETITVSMQHEEMQMTLDAIRGAFKTDSDVTSPRTASQGWSPDWAVQNSQPFRFQLPVSFLKTQKAVKTEEEGEDIDAESEEIGQEVAEVAEEDQFMMEPEQTEATADTARLSPSKKHRKWLPPLRRIPIPMTGILKSNTQSQQIEPLPEGDEPKAGNSE
mmetsp:Transcript_59034/g.104921  ORF Transcript_59034/g.104921 Transcript_59034/m.104921 type:complete len:653 (-) Transcript_59034:47-2005(-)